MWVYILIAAAVALIIWLIIGYVMMNTTIVRSEKVKSKKRNEEEKYIKRAERRARDKASLFERNPEDVSVTTYDGLTLRGWFFKSSSESNRFVIFSHGHKCNGIDEFSHIAPFYLDDLKYNVLMPDHRAHGRSDGKYIGFSVLDSEDILLWVDFLTERYGENIEIIMHGASMGAATVLLANEKPNIQPQVKLIIEDCGFSSASEEFSHVISKSAKIKGKPIIAAANIFARLLAKYDFRDSNALKNIEKSKNPILFVHGTADTYVPTYMGERMYEACRVPKDILLVKDAVHVFSYYDAPEDYNDKIRAFIEKNLGEVYK